jgi:hypothetical protein
MEEFNEEGYLQLTSLATELCKKHFYDPKTKKYCDGNGCPEEFRSKCIDKDFGGLQTKESLNEHTRQMNLIAEKYLNTNVS